MNNKQLTGREIDALITEKIMGWSPGTFGKSCNVPHWSTDIVDAFSLVNRMRTRGYRLMLNDDTFGPGCQAIFIGHGCGYSANADSFALAICLAALLSVGTEV